MTEQVIPSIVAPAARRPDLKTFGRHPLVVTPLVYLFALSSMATVGAIVPFLVPLTRALHSNGGAIGIGIALFSLPAALLATVGGALIDRVGIRRAVIAGGFVIALGDGLIRSAGHVLMFDAGLLVAGIGFAGIVVGAPALLMGVLHGNARTRCMAFFSTFAPTGFALGLLIAIPFAASGAWRGAILSQLVLVLAVTLAGGLLLPTPDPVAPDPARSRGGWTTILSFRAAVRLGIAIALPNGIAYGTSLVAPSYLARVHGISLAASAGAVAAAKIAALILGGLITGQILSSRRKPWTVFAAMVAVGIAAQIAFFAPGRSFVFSVCALMLWLFAFGGMSGVAMSLLPRVVPDPSKKAATAGLVNQLISVTSFAAPSTYFAMQGWTGFVGLAVAGLVISLAILPALRIESTAAPV